MHSRIFLTTGILGLLALLPSCSPGAENKKTYKINQDNPVGTIPKASARAAAGGATAQASGASGRSIAEENDRYSFSFSYPAEAGRIAALKSWFDAQLEKDKAALLSDVAEAEKDAKENGYEYRGFSYGAEWQRVADTPRYLSLSATISSYSGGAHGNYGFDSLLWDKKAGKRMKPLDLFTSDTAFTASIVKAFCTQLDRQRAKKREGLDDKSSIPEFDACINPAENTVILGSTDKVHFDKIGILIGPYSAGPYAEGAYEVTLPVTQAALQAVKPEYRNAFRVKT
ncbi:DUF3298 and DUF4163 domain-containing protein [Sphingorhabdus arenilitoris]|uniref:DUF3298 and DUF4163 domain-containing protein n=1 Tax=Sphingorhabdus arenilitoris TaxID=1490041 RepID=A0ABV8RE51_9SPHN